MSNTVKNHSEPNDNSPLTDPESVAETAKPSTIIDKPKVTAPLITATQKPLFVESRFHFEEPTYRSTTVPLDRQEFFCEPYYDSNTNHFLVCCLCNIFCAPFTLAIHLCKSLCCKSSHDPKIRRRTYYPNEDSSLQWERDQDCFGDVELGNKMENEATDAGVSDYTLDTNCESEADNKGHSRADNSISGVYKRFSEFDKYHTEPDNTRNSKKITTHSEDNNNTKKDKGQLIEDKDNTTSVVTNTISTSMEFTGHSVLDKDRAGGDMSQIGSKCDKSSDLTNSIIMSHSVDNKGHTGGDKGHKDETTCSISTSKGGDSNTESYHSTRYSVGHSDVDNGHSSVRQSGHSDSGLDASHSEKDTGYSGGDTSHSGGDTGNSGGNTGYSGGDTSYSGGDTGCSGGDSGGGGGSDD